jgi:hypothetical protein
MPLSVHIASDDRGGWLAQMLAPHVINHSLELLCLTCIIDHA